jgi:hypothetical protein
MNEQAALIAEGAAGLIREKGLAKGDWSDADGGLCLAGAVRAVADAMCPFPSGWQAAYWRVLKAAHSLAREQMLADGRNPVVMAAYSGLCRNAAVFYNDLAETSQEDVELLLKKTAAALRETDAA